MSDLEGGMVDANDAFLELTRLLGEEIKRMKHADFLAPDCVEEIKNGIRATLESRQAVFR